MTTRELKAKRALENFVELFLNRTTHPMWVASLPNVRGSGGERHVLTREFRRIAEFVKKWDIDERSTYYCIASLKKMKAGTERKKDSAQEVWFFHADVDFKAIECTPDEALERIKSMGVWAPTFIVQSGGGLHCYWVLKHTVLLGQGLSVDNYERLLKRLANVVAGDPMVCQCVSYLRLPGSHNTKRGDGVLVDTVWESKRKYELGEMDEWLTHVAWAVIIRKTKDGDNNPFLAHANSQGMRAPIDVDQMLNDMEWVDGGGGNVHATQLSVSASLMNQGYEIDEAVDIIMEATRKIGAPTWNWQAEEKGVRGMCSDFVKKHGNEVRERSSEIKRESPRTEKSEAKEATVHSLAAKREELVELKEVKEEEAKAKAREKKLKKRDGADVHVVLGRGFLDALEQRSERVMYADGRMHRYRKGLWTGYSSDDEKTWLAVEMEMGCRALESMGVVATTKLVNEAVAWVKRNPDLHREDVPWDSHGKIATKSGLVDPKTFALTPTRPDHFVTYQIDCEYDPEADCPTWKRMMGEYFDAETTAVIQEALGAALVPDKPRSVTRALVFQGPSNSGKSTILNVLAGLISPHANTTPLSLLENPHGTVPFLKPVPWVLHEAFDQTRWELSAVVKALLSGDPVSVNIKNGALVTHRFRAPTFWGTNVPPQFRESSRAMENRLIVVPVRTVFHESRPTGVAVEAIRKGYSSPADLVLDLEKPGLLKWALEGYRKLADRGEFALTRSMRDALSAMREDSNMATGFFSECIEYDPASMVRNPDLYGAFSVWHRENRGGQTPSTDGLARAIRALGDDRVKLGQRYGHIRHYAGLRLNESGTDYWNAYAMSAFSERSGLRISDRAEDVNRAVPDQSDPSD